MGQMWSNLAAEEKERYHQLAAQERERVAKEVEEWKEANGGQFPGWDSKNNNGNNHNNGNNVHHPSDLTFPVARIRKICKLDPDVRGLSKEALYLITKCAELATTKLGTESVKVAQAQNRRKLLPDDVAHVCTYREQFEFLKEDIKDLVNANSSSSTTSTSAQEANRKKLEAAAAGSKPLTSYFTGKTTK